MSEMGSKKPEPKLIPDEEDVPTGFRIGALDEPWLAHRNFLRELLGVKKEWSESVNHQPA
jgi:hypothetical protein